MSRLPLATLFVLSLAGCSYSDAPPLPGTGGSDVGGTAESTAERGGAVASGVTTSAESIYVVHYSAQSRPPVAGAPHAWELRIEDSSGEPIRGAAITLIGSMPDHPHGLAAEPRVIADDRPGIYRVEGVEFQMQGRWELSLGISSAAGTDSTLIAVDVVEP